jgi:hypothetical protein
MNISDAIIIAIISAGVNLGVAYLQNRTKGIEREKKESARNQHIDDCLERFDDRFDAIETRLDEHNHYAKKFEEVNMKIGKIDNKIDLLQKDFEYCKR